EGGNDHGAVSCRADGPPEARASSLCGRMWLGQKRSEKSDVAAIFINNPAGCQRVLLLPDIVSRDLPKARGRQKRSVRSDEIRRIRKLICGGWPIIRSRTF